MDRGQEVAIGVGIAGAGERGEVALVGSRVQAEEGERKRDGEAERVVREVVGPEGGDQVGGVPAGRDGVLHVVAFGRVCGGKVARVAGEGGVSNEISDAGGFGGIGTIGGADSWVEVLHVGG